MQSIILVENHSSLRILIGSNVIRNTRVTRSSTPPPVIIATRSNLVKRPSKHHCNASRFKPARYIESSNRLLSLGRKDRTPRKCCPPIGGRAIKLGWFARPLPPLPSTFTLQITSNAVSTPLSFAPSTGSPRCLGIVSAWPARIVNPAILRGVNSLAAQPTQLQVTPTPIKLMAAGQIATRLGR